MIYICATCKSTNVQTLEWIKPNTETSGEWPHTAEIPSGDPYGDSHNPAHNWCNNCDAPRALYICTPEEYLAKLGGVSCGLNADWCVQAWHFGPTGVANTHQGDYYILDLEDDEHLDAFELVQRFYTDLNDEINTIAQGDAETMVAAVRALLKAWEARQ